MPAAQATNQTRWLWLDRLIIHLAASTSILTPAGPAPPLAPGLILFERLIAALTLATNSAD
jgi:hypothetical protein